MKKRIFALDNEKLITLLIKKTLSDDDLEIITCNEPDKAITMITEDDKGFDLIIADINMPKLNGFDFLDELKSHKNFYYVPIIFLTSSNDNELRIRAYKNNVFDFLVKPINTKTFKYKIHSILDNYDELRKSVFTIKKGKFEGKDLNLIMRFTEKEKINGYLLIENKHQGRCRIELDSGHMQTIVFYSKKGEILSDDTALDKILKFRSGQYTIYLKEIENFFTI